MIVERGQPSEREREERAQRRERGDRVGAHLRRVAHLKRLKVLTPREGAQAAVGGRPEPAQHEVAHPRHRAEAPQRAVVDLHPRPQRRAAERMAMGVDDPGHGGAADPREPLESESAERVEGPQRIDADVGHRGHITHAELVEVRLAGEVAERLVRRLGVDHPQRAWLIQRRGVGVARTDDRSVSCAREAELPPGASRLPALSPGCARPT